MGRVNRHCRQSFCDSTAADHQMSLVGRRFKTSKTRWFFTQCVDELCKPLPQGAIDVKTCVYSRDGWTTSRKGKSVVAY